MSRPFANSLIQKLETEFGRAREIGDTATLKAILDELQRRRQRPRNARLIVLVAEALNADISEPDTRVFDQPTNSSKAQRNPDRNPSAVPFILDFRPTQEQEEAVELFARGENLKINAYAGSGKTSTLQLLAHSTRQSGQYLAFNKRIVVDSQNKFPPNVKSATTHSVAYRSLVGRYGGPKLTERLNINQLVELMDIKKWRIDKNHVLEPRSQAYLILATIRRYCQSDSPSMLSEHVPRHGKLATASQDVLHLVNQMAMSGAQYVWDRMRTASDPLPLGHDGYLKLWALSDPIFPADYILLDEAQDTNPVVLGVLNKQPSQIVYVGDKYQQIYEWRGAINAMEKAYAPLSTQLSTSFRFGGDIAWAANRVLTMLGEHKALTGNPRRESRIQAGQAGTVLARTNATTITACIEALDAGDRPHLVGGTQELKQMLLGVKELKQGFPSSVPEFFGFENWQEVVEFVRSGEGEDLQTFVNLVEARGEDQLLWALNRVVDEGHANITISTAHKAKGREWPQVRLMDDFLKSLPKKDEQGQSTKIIDPAELRLLYVALTRARDVMCLPSGLLEFLRTGDLPAATGTAVPPAGSTHHSASSRQKTWSRPNDWEPDTDRSAKPSPQPAEEVQRSNPSIFDRLFRR